MRAPAGEVSITEDVAGAFATLVARRAPRTLALSGGTTAERCYEQLRTATVEWSAVEVLFGDERWVPVDHPESNERLARRALLDHVRPAHVHSLREAGTTPDAAAAAYDGLLRGLGSIDVVHLGLGPDAHTASLFPGSPALEESRALVVTAGDTAHPHPRLTFTYPGIALARLVVFTVSGEKKREAFAAVRAGADVPAARVEADRIVWLVDREAAGELAETVA